MERTRVRRRSPPVPDARISSVSIISSSVVGGAPLPNWVYDTDASDDACLLGASVAAERPMGLAAVFWQARASMLEPIRRIVVVGIGDVGLAGRVVA